MAPQFQRDNGYLSPQLDLSDSDDETVAGSDIDVPFAEKRAFIQRSPTLPQWTSQTSRRISQACTPAACTSLSRSLALALLPSYLSNRISRAPITPERYTGVAALDGLRGLACLFVFNEHFSYNYTNAFLIGYGVGSPANPSYFIQLPFIRLLWSGFSMVAVFYVISGYVLSYKALKQIRSKDMANFQKTLASSVLRRAIRLYVPTISAVLICGLLVYLGAFNHSTQVWNKNGNYLHLHERPPLILEGFYVQMKDALWHTFPMLDVWSWSVDLSAGDYDKHLWTIVVEFRSSMVLFLVLVGTSRLKETARLLILIGLIIFCIMTARSDILLFVSGMLIAELDMIRKAGYNKVLPTISFRGLPSNRSASSLAWPVVFVAGLYFASVPTIGAPETFGYVHLTSWVPDCFLQSEAFLRAAGAILITWAVANSTILEPIFTNRFTTYLGKISYALYIVHGNVLKTVGYSALPTIYSIFGDGTPESLSMRGFVSSWFLGALVVVPVTFWISDIFWRAIDVPSVKFARWVEDRISAEFDETVSTAK